MLQLNSNIPIRVNPKRTSPGACRAGSSSAKVACRGYQPFAALLEEEAALALDKTGPAEVTVSEKDLPILATALERYIRVTTCDHAPTLYPMSDLYSGPSAWS